MRARACAVVLGVVHVEKGTSGLHTWGTSGLGHRFKIASVRPHRFKSVMCAARVRAGGAEHVYTSLYY